MSGVCRLILILLACIAPTASVVAQEGKRIVFGPVIGGSFSQMLDGYLKEVQAGFSAGFFARWQLGPSLALRPELMYNQRGGRRERDISYGMGAIPYSQSSIRIHNLEMPILLELALPEQQGQQPRLLLGPTICRVLHVSGKSTSLYSWSPNEYEGASGQLEMGVVTGIGFYSGRPHSWIFDLRLSWMLGSVSGGESYRDRTIQAIIGYALW